ncbi:MAG: transglutaminase-like domain-containing protein [Planctomycetota bacterium]
MNRAFPITFLWMTAACVASVGCGRPAAMGQELPEPEEHWFVVQLQDQRCGYMHTRVKPVGREVHTHTIVGLNLRRGKAELKITIEQHHRESSDGRPLAFKQVTHLGLEPVTIEGTIRDDRLTLTRDQLGARKTDTYDFDPDIKFAWGMSLLQKEKGLEPGTSFTVKSYDPGIREDGPFEVLLEVHDKQRVELPGNKFRLLTRVTSTMQLPVPITSNSWLDDDATPLITDLNMGAFAFRILHASKEEALAEGTPPELFLSTFVTVDKKVDRTAKMLKLRLKLPDDAAISKMPDLPDTAMQKVRRISDTEAVVTIRRLDWKALADVPASAADPAMDQYLKASTTLDADDKRIQHHAKKAVRGADTPAQKARALRKYVTDFITSKGLDVGFASASEVIRNRKGDCTEHGVLLAALARAAGLPARCVSGIVLIPPGTLAPDSGSAFGYHMWTQVNIGGTWVDIDAALRQTDCDPTHVALAIMPLNDEGVANSVITLLPFLGRLQMEVLAVEE